MIVKKYFLWLDGKIWPGRKVRKSSELSLKIQKLIIIFCTILIVDREELVCCHVIIDHVTVMCCSILVNVHVTITPVNQAQLHLTFSMQLAMVHNMLNFYYLPAFRDEDSLKRHLNTLQITESNLAAGQAPPVPCYGIG